MKVYEMVTLHNSVSHILENSEIFYIAICQ